DIPRRTEPREVLGRHGQVVRDCLGPTLRGTSVIRWKTNRSQNRLPSSSLSGELKDLLSGRAVQLCLLLTAFVQVAAVVGESHDASAHGRTALLAPVLVQPGGESVSSLWSRQAVEMQAR